MFPTPLPGDGKMGHSSARKDRTRQDRFVSGTSIVA